MWYDKIHSNTNCSDKMNGNDNIHGHDRIHHNNTIHGNAKINGNDIWWKSELVCILTWYLYVVALL